MKINQSYFFLTVIFLIGGVFRFTGLNWDLSSHLHPDERFLTMVSQSMKFPSGFKEYFDTPQSTLNPHNIGYPFYVYGTIPVILVKISAHLASLDSYDGITLVGRFISALLDTGNILLVFLLARRLFKNIQTALFSGLYYALAVLPIQMSHYFTVDTFSVFFLLFAIFLFPAGWFLSSIIFGLAIASKVNIIFFTPLFIAFIILSSGSKKIHLRLIMVLLFLIGVFVSIRFFQPYLFAGLGSINSLVIDNWRQLKSFENPNLWYPPGVQWITTPKLLFSINNMFFWGLGPVLFIIGFFSLVYVLLSNTRSWTIKIIGLTIIANLAYQGWQYAQPLRYLYPIYPLLAIFGGYGLYTLFTRLHNRSLKIIIIGLCFFWPISFLSVYYRPNSRIVASDWMTRNLPAGSVVSCEHWDDCLPLGYQNRFSVIQLPLFNPDTPQKWMELENQLSQVDYLVLSSNRLYGSISSVPEKYPVTSKFYTDLFANKLDFTLIAQFTSRPNLPVPGVKICLTPPLNHYGFISRILQDCPLPGISIVDDYADETFTVYDHPKVFIFKKLPPGIQQPQSVNPSL